MMRYALILAFVFLGGCASTPTERQVRLDVDWVKTTLVTENYGFRHAERTAPLLQEDVLYQGNAIDSFVALDRVTGNVIWRHEIRNGVESGSAIEGDLIYFGASDGQFYALNKFSGKVAWTFPTRVENLGPPLVKSGVVYFIAGNNVLYALDSKTGKQLWFYNRGDVSSLSVRGATRPALYENILYAGFSDGYLVALNSKDGSMAWERKLTTNVKFVDVDASPVVDDNYIWVSSFDGALFCLSRRDGQVQWRLDDGGAVPVTIEGDNLYFASLGQNIYSLNKKTGVQKWKFNFEEKWGVPTQPVLFKGLVIFGTSDGDVMALSASTGKLLATYRPGTGSFATPAVDASRNRVYIFSNQSNLHLLKVAWVRPEDSLEWK